ncbi:MAG: DUF2817 domain-containing protein [Burkholderiaceae bacterium]
MIGAIGVIDAFSTSYAQARVKFLEAAATAGLQIESFNHLLPGKDGEVVALDAALQKPAKAKVAEKLLVVNSASKAADSFGGSGVQVFVLHDAEWMEKVRAAGVSVLYLHGSDQSLADVVKKHVLNSKKVILVDISAANSLEDTVFEALAAAKLDNKCKFSAVKPITAGAPAWEGQTISLARQALFKAVDALKIDALSQA